MRVGFLKADSYPIAGGSWYNVQTGLGEHALLDLE
jgi:hypothetical protein